MYIVVKVRLNAIKEGSTSDLGRGLLELDSDLGSIRHGLRLVVNRTVYQLLAVAIRAACGHWPWVPLARAQCWTLLRVTLTLPCPSFLGRERPIERK